MTYTKEKTAAGRSQRTYSSSRGLLWLKTFFLLALVIIDIYGTFKRGLFPPELWAPVAGVILGLLFITLFVSRYYDDVSGFGWVLVGFMATLVLIKGLSFTWSVGRDDTIQEMLRSAMYLGTFVLALASLSSRRQVPWLLDGANLVIALVAGYGLMQKVDPVHFPPTSLDGVRIGTTLEYPNTAAVMVAMGIVLASARMVQTKSVAVRALYAPLVLAFFAALYFTFSRGAMLSLGLGAAVLFVITAHRLRMFTNLALVAVPGAWLMWQVQGLDGLLQSNAPQQQRISEGAVLGTDLIVALLAAAVLQAGYAALSNRYELMPGVHRALGALVLAGIVLVGGLGTAQVLKQYGGPEGVYGTFVSNDEPVNPNQRLVSVSNKVRLEYWKVGLKEWKEHPWTGSGAGTFSYTWNKDRPGLNNTLLVHNVYLEQGTETGVFAFLAFVAFALGVIIYPAWTALRASGERRLWLAGLSAAIIVYLTSSFAEWHWYLPASTILFFILAASAVKLASRVEWDTPS